MTRRWALAFTSLALVFLTACPPDRGPFGPEGRSAFVRYVSIGTSISEGWQSDGVVYTSQVNSWPLHEMPPAVYSQSPSLLQQNALYGPLQH